MWSPWSSRQRASAQRPSSGRGISWKRRRALLGSEAGVAVGDITEEVGIEGVGLGGESGRHGGPFLRLPVVKSGCEGLHDRRSGAFGVGLILRFNQADGNETGNWGG